MSYAQWTKPVPLQQMDVGRRLQKKGICYTWWNVNISRMTRHPKTRAYSNYGVSLVMSAIAMQ